MVARKILFQSHITMIGTLNDHFLIRNSSFKCHSYTGIQCNTVKLSKLSIGLSRVKKIIFQNFFWISIMLLIHIMGICCGPFEFFCLGGQYYGLGHPSGQPHYLDTLVLSFVFQAAHQVTGKQLLVYVCSVNKDLSKIISIF